VTREPTWVFMQLRSSALVLGVILLLAVGCGAPFGDALNAFDAGRYADAAAELARLERQSASFSQRDHARYALYRGLTHLALGEANRADRWLCRVKTLLARNAELLDDGERGRFRAAWRSMGRMPGE
jgi:hypothetical protein